MRPYRRGISFLLSLAVALLPMTSAALGNNAGGPGPRNAPAKAAEMRLGAPTYAPSEKAGSATNPIEEAPFFVRQHYRDFLNREPDASGLAFWVNQITECETRPAAERQGCREVRRINVSAAFFLSIEFQETGYFVYKMYQAAYGVRPGEPVPVTLGEFLPDLQQIGRGVVIGQPGALQQLEANKVAYASQFVARPRFDALEAMTPAQFIDTLNANTENALAPAQIHDLVGRLSAGQITRARALREVAQHAGVSQKFFTRAFVLMQYYGYLRRNPNDSPEPGLNFNGYNFWLGKLNQFNGNFVAAEMVKAFITSGEYLSRFGPQAVTLTPATVQTGKTVTVNITGQFTSFIKNITRARFGDGVSVGGAAAGEFGPVNVIDKTHATAEVTVAGSAAPGLRSVTLETGAERLVLDGIFTVSALSSLAVSADVDRTTGVLGTSFTFTGRVLQSTSPVEQWHWTLSDGRELTGMSISVSFPAPGLYGADLTATDREGNVVHAETGVMVFDPATQAPPELGLPKQIGDIDGDGLITLTDAHRVSKHAGGLELLPADAEPAADVDLDQRVTQDDARLLGQAVAAGAPLPSALLPARGAPGTRVTLISPALLDPTANIEIAVGESRWVQQPLRLVRGYANIVVPFDATHSGSMQVTPGPVEVRVLNNGVAVDTLKFQVEAPLPLPADPKAELRKLLDDNVELLRINQDAIRLLFDQALVDGKERELLLTVYTVAQEDIAAKMANMRALLDAPGGDELAQLFFLYANANGYPELRQRLTELSASGVPTLRSSLKAMAAAADGPSADEILNVLCQVKKAAEALSDFNDVLSVGCDGLLALALAAAVFPGDGPAGEAALLLSWASLCGTASAALEMAQLVGEKFGNMETELLFEATPTSPQAGQTVQLRATIKLKGIEALCNFGAGQATDELIEDIGEEAVKRLLSKKFALKAVSAVLRLLSKDLIDELEDRLEQAGVDLVNSTVLGEALREFTSKVCSYANGGVPIVDDLSKIMQGPMPDVGVRTFLGDGTANYTCPDQGNSTADNVTFTATRQSCDKQLEKTVTVSCRSRQVTITMGDNGSLNDDIFEVRIQGKTVLTSSSPVRSTSTTVNLAVGDHTVEMIGRAAPDGVGTYFIQFSGATLISGASSGSDLTPGVVKTFLIRVQ